MTLRLLRAWHMLRGPLYPRGTPVKILSGLRAGMIMESRHVEYDWEHAYYIYILFRNDELFHGYGEDALGPTENR